MLSVSGTIYVCRGLVETFLQNFIRKFLFLRNKLIKKGPDKSVAILEIRKYCSEWPRYVRAWAQPED